MIIVIKFNDFQNTFKKYMKMFTVNLWTNRNIRLHCSNFVICNIEK